MGLGELEVGGGVVAELDVGRPVGDEDVGDADVEDLEDVGDADVVVAVLLGQPVGDVEVVAVELAEVVAELVDELLPPPRIEVRIEVGIGPGELLDACGQAEVDVGEADVELDVGVVLLQLVGVVDVVAVELVEVVAVDVVEVVVELVDEAVDELLPPTRIEVRIEVGIGPGELLDVVGQLEAVAAGVAATAAVPVPVIATVAATPAIPASAMPDDPMTTRADRLRRCSG